MSGGHEAAPFGADSAASDGGAGTADRDGRPWRLAVTGDYATEDGATIYGDIGLDELAAAGIDWEIVGGADEPLRPALLEGFDAVLLLGPMSLGATELEGVTTLRHVARFGAGFDAVDLEACDALGIAVTNAPHGLRKPMAHTALTFLFSLAHNLLPKDRLARGGDWARKAQLHGRGLLGSRIGVIGLGGIGQETVRQLRALDLDVAAWNRSPRPEVCAELGIEQLGLDELLGRSDFLVVTVAANAQTKHLIGAKELARMPEGSFLVNIARGSVLDQDALVEALRSGHLAGAGLDVFEVEPLPTTSPLVAMENVVLAPHSLCWTRDFVDATAAEVRGEILAVAQGREPRNLVNLPRG